MSAEFVDTNILVYAHDSSAGSKHKKSVELLTRLVTEGTGAISTQVLAEFYSLATRKLGMTSQSAEEVLEDLGAWILHRPDHADIVNAARLQRRHKIGWWDALVMQSAQALDCRVLWTEDFHHERKYGLTTARNPFR